MYGYSNYRGGAMVRTADDWKQFIAGGRSKVARPVDNNTVARLMDEGMVAIKLHDTDVVTIFSDGRQILNSGGWLSMTTKDRINRYSTASISQRKGVWYINDRDGNETLFYDGMVVDRDGYPLKPRKTAAYEKKLAAIKKQARQYAKDYVTELKAGNIAMPSAGDCWGCYFALSNTERIPVPSRGKAQPFGTSHLHDHMTEKYYVPSLLVNAGRAAGYQDHQIGLMGIGGQRLFVDPENNIYKYIVKALQGDL
jgi:hypothetical protein